MSLNEMVFYIRKVLRFPDAGVFDQNPSRLKRKDHLEILQIVYDLNLINDENTDFWKFTNDEFKFRVYKRDTYDGDTEIRFEYPYEGMLIPIKICLNKTVKNCSIWISEDITYFEQVDDFFDARPNYNNFRFYYEKQEIPKSKKLIDVYKEIAEYRDRKLVYIKQYLEYIQNGEYEKLWNKFNENTFKKGNMIWNSFFSHHIVSWLEAGYSFEDIMLYASLILNGQWKHDFEVKYQHVSNLLDIDIALPILKEEVFPRRDYDTKVNDIKKLLVETVTSIIEFQRKEFDIEEKDLNIYNFIHVKH